MSAIPWTVVDPDTIERMIAVGLCRRHTQARRIKPSQGDGGLDVLVPVSGGSSQLHVENYQVKKFADGLNDSRERQIKKSLERAVATHNDDRFGYRIDRWHLAVPMDLTREQERWLLGLATELEAPFPVGIFGLTAIEDLLLEAPNIREYYLGDGMEKVSQILKQMTNLADLESLIVDPTKVEPGDTIVTLADLHAHINAADPHFDYDYQVSADLPTITPGPGLIASVIVRNTNDAPYVTWHVFAKYETAVEDRPIPGSYTVYLDRMTSEQKRAWERWRKYGTPVTLADDTIADVTMDLPGGLPGPEPTGEQALKLGPAHGQFDDEPTTRVLWVIEDKDGTKLAERLFNFRLVARGQEGGEHRHGSDTDGYITADLYTRQVNEAAGTVEGGLQLHTERWVGEPVQRVLPMLRFCAALGNDNHLKAQDEFGLQDPAELRTLAGNPPIDPVELAVVEDLIRISAATGRPIGMPANMQPLCIHRGSSIHSIADVVSGIPVDVRVGEAVLWYENHPDAYEDLERRAAAGELTIPWPMPFALFGEDFKFPFILEIPEAVTIEPAEPTEGQPPTRKAARVIVTDTTTGRVRMDIDP